MSPIRIIPALALAFALGAVASGLLMQGRGSLMVNEVPGKTERVRTEPVSTDKDNGRERALNAEIVRLEQALATARDEVRKAEHEAASRALELSFYLEGPESDGAVSETTGPTPDDAPDGERRGRWDDLSEEDREAMMERRRAFAADLQERMHTYLDDLRMQSTDVYEQERLAVLQEYVDYMAELRGQMRDAETDEEREQLGELMRWSGGEMAGIMRDQQRHLLHRVAEEYGITDAGQQRAFVSRMRELQHDPFFRGSMVPGAGGGGFRGRGGGGPGGFFGGPGQRP